MGHGSSEASAYDTWADYYDLTDADRSPFIDFYGSLVGGGAPRSILDLGCGTGTILAALHERLTSRPTSSASQAVGLDGSARMLSVARRRYPRIAWVLADI